MPDNSGYYIISCYWMSSECDMICKYTFSASSAQCYTYQTFNEDYGYVMLSPTEFIILFPPNAGNSNLNIAKITYGSSSSDWVKGINWQTSSWTASTSESLISSTESNKFYSLISYGNPKYAYFLSMNSTTGALIDSRYKSNVACGDVYGFKQKDTYLLASIKCTSFYLFLIDTTSFSFTIRKFAGNSLFGIAIDPSDGR